MTPTEFRELIAGNNDATLLDVTLRSEDAPFAFELNPANWDSFRTSVSADLGVEATDIRIVGSGRLGFSLKPGNNLRTFQDTSDIDVVVVNRDAFDDLWLSLLRAAYPRPPIDFGSRLQQCRKNLYTGWITPDEIRLDLRILGEKARPVLQTRTKWFNCLKGASKFPSRRHEDIHARLYRTWEHAELYHLHSIASLRNSLKA
jgi:hypothetical protein